MADTIVPITASAISTPTITSNVDEFIHVRMTRPYLAASAASIPNLTSLATASVLRNFHELTLSAPLVRTKAVNGNGGGIIDRAAMLMTAPVVTRCWMRVNRGGLTSRARPCLPSFHPSQNVTDAPTTEPAVASA